MHLEVICSDIENIRIIDVNYLDGFLKEMNNYRLVKSYHITTVYINIDNNDDSLLYHDSITFYRNKRLNLLFS